jgi:uncharacterized protein
MNWFEQARWSPYVVGAGIGVLSWLTFLLSDKPLACSTSFAKAAGMLERVFRGDRVNERPYYREFAPNVDWGVMLVIGLFFGALTSALLSGPVSLNWTSAVWVARFGANPMLRWVVALGGGVLMGFGARWANGCTSGHGISGTLQLTASSWLASICFFAGGIVVALLLYH